ncbi:MAG: hypothetical protein WCT18_03900 [Patescibacteria group bacterium]
MSLTVISIIALIICIAIIWGAFCMVKVEPTVQVVIGKNFGTQPYKILKTGLHWIKFPFRRILSEIQMEKLELNIQDFRAVCTMNRNQFLDLPPDYSGLAEIAIPNISINGELSFLDRHKKFDPERFEAFNLLQEKKPDGKIDLSKMYEIITDMVKNIFVSIIANGDLVNTLKTQFVGYDSDSKTDYPLSLGDICEYLNAGLEKQHIPVKINTISIDNPPTIVDETLRNSWNKISQGAMLDQAQALELKRELDAADKRIAIARKKTEEQQISLEMLAKLYNVPSLPPTEQARFWLEREALAAYRDLATNAKATVFMSGDILSQISGMLKHFTEK